MSKDRDQFVALLARELPDQPICNVAEIAAKLMNLASRYGRIQVRDCNGEALPGDEKREKATEERIAELCKAFGWSAKLGGDPRGYTVKLLLPSKRYNTWGGEEDGWGVPGS